MCINRITIRNHIQTKYNTSVKTTNDCIPEDDKYIALSVTNLHKAVKCYQEVFGFGVINGPIEIVIDDSPLGMVLKDIHVPNLKKMRIVWLSSGNQVGFEIFGFIDPKAERRTNDNLNIGNQDFSISVLPLLT